MFGQFKRLAVVAAATVGASTALVIGGGAAYAESYGVTVQNCTLTVVSYTHGSGGLADIQDLTVAHYTCQ